MRTATDDRAATSIPHSAFRIPHSAIRIPHFRRGFTLVELLVAVALTIVIMGIIGWAMGKSIDTFRNLNGVVNLQSKLVAAQIVMQRDLSAEHFGGNFQAALSGPYVADQRLDQFGWMPPAEGYFEIRQGSEGILEGFDADGLWSTRAVDHSLRFTARLTGRREEDWFYAYPDPGQAALLPAWGDVNFNRTPGIATRWAEIAYFLYPINKNANGTQLYALYRQQKAIQSLPTTPATNPLSSDLSRLTGGGNGYNSTSTVTNPLLRGIQYSGTTPLPSGGVKLGDDILITDVISFEIKVLYTTGPASGGLQPPRSVGLSTYYGTQRLFNVDWPFDVLPNIPGWGMRFDTMTQTIAPASSTNWDDPGSFLAPSPNLPRSRIRVQALQIKVRVWDFNTNQARQMTFVQDI